MKKSELYYSNFSVLECLWVLVSLERKNVAIEMETVETGLKSIERSYKRVVEEAKVFHEKRFREYDRFLAAISD